jgi:type II secretory pathway pseudopilin PulG
MRKHLGVVLFLALAVAGLMAVAVPNLLTARSRSRQKHTMADMRTLASAFEARATDTTFSSTSNVA